MRLKDIVPKDRCLFEFEAENWMETVRASGGLLLKDECIEEGYIRDVINVIDQFGPYMIVSKGIALLHAQPSDKVLETAVSMLVLNKEIEFGHKEHDPVKIVFMFAAVSGESHISMMKKLAEVLKEEENVEIIKSAKMYEDLNEIK